jgi:hypothetical protein
MGYYPIHPPHPHQRHFLSKYKKFEKYVPILFNKDKKVILEGKKSLGGKKILRVIPH